MEDIKERPTETAELHERTEVVDALVKQCISTQRGFHDLDPKKAIEAAKLGASPSSVESLVQVYVEQGNYRSAAQAAKLREGGVLTTKEIDAMATAYLTGSGGEGNTIDAAVEVAKFGASESVIDDLAQYYIDRDERHPDYIWLTRAIKIAELGASEKMSDDLVRRCLEKAGIENKNKNFWLKHSIFSARTGASQSTVDDLVQKILSYCDDTNWSCRHEGVDPIEAAKCGTSQGVLDLLTKTFIDNDLLEDASEVAKLGASQSVLDDLIQKLDISKAFIDSDIDNIIALAECGASESVIDELYRACVEKGWTGKAIRVAKLRASEPLTTEEIRKLIKEVSE
jgi:hypothetical protein